MEKVKGNWAQLIQCSPGTKLGIGLSYFYLVYSLTLAAAIYSSARVVDYMTFSLPGTVLSSVATTEYFQCQCIIKVSYISRFYVGCLSDLVKSCYCFRLNMSSNCNFKHFKTLHIICLPPYKILVDLDTLPLTFFVIHFRSWSCTSWA